jgi:hypothetical protein
MSYMVASEWPVAGCDPWCICQMCEVCEISQESARAVFFVHFRHKMAEGVTGTISVRADSLGAALESIKHVSGLLPHYSFRL